MNKSYFVWRAGSRGPMPAIFHFNPNDMGRDEKEYGPRILASHVIPDDLQERVEVASADEV